MIDLKTFDDNGVETALKDAVLREAQSTAHVLRCLTEFEERRLVEKKAYPSFFAYCTEALGYSEDGAYKRIRAARTAMKHPQILTLLEQRRTNLWRIVIVSPHLTVENREDLLERACRMRKCELEFFVAGLAPKHNPRDMIRSVPCSALSRAPSPTPFIDHSPNSMDSPACPHVSLPAASSSAEPQVRLTRVEPITETLARLSCTIDRAAADDLNRACALLRVRKSNAGTVIARALTALLREIDPDRRPKSKRASNPRNSAACRQPAAMRIKKPRTLRSLLRPTSKLTATPRTLAPVLRPMSKLTATPRTANPSARRPPKHIQKSVWERDGGRCTFTDALNNRCVARSGLEFDHIRPWAAGGLSNDVENIRIMCRMHNKAEARLWFGGEYIDRVIADRRLSGAGPP